GGGRGLGGVAPPAVGGRGPGAAASRVLLLAARLGRTKERADALVQLAGPIWAGLRAVLLAVAAELHAEVGATDLARRSAEQACEADPTCARAVAALAVIAGAQRERIGAAAGERAPGII